MKRELAFAYSAGEFLDEELFELKDKFGKNLKFFTDGECIINKESRHPYEYWTFQESINELNDLLKNEQI